MECVTKHLLALLGRSFALVRAEEKFTVKQLHTDDSEDKLEQQVYD